MSSKITKPATILLFIALMAAFIAYKAGVFDSRQPDVTVTVNYEQKITPTDSIGIDSMPIMDTQIIETTTSTVEISGAMLSTSKSLIIDDGRKKETPKKVISTDSFHLSERDILMSSKTMTGIILPKDFKFPDSTELRLLSDSLWKLKHH